MRRMDVFARTPNINKDLEIMESIVLKSKSQAQVWRLESRGHVCSEAVCFPSLEQKTCSLFTCLILRAVRFWNVARRIGAVSLGRELPQH